MLYQKILLKSTPTNLTTVEVNALQSRLKTETNLATTLISSKDINKIPSLTIQGDMAQYLDFVPGVISSGEQGGQIYINGGAPHQNLTWIDGIQIVNPFHSLGGFSVVSSENGFFDRIERSCFWCRIWG